MAAQKFAPEWLSSVTSVLGRYWKLPLSQRCDASVLALVRCNEYNTG